MSEAARFFRYAIPGGIAELVVGFWLLIDPARPLTGSENVAAPVAAVAIAAALPFGFLLANVGFSAGAVWKWTRGQRQPAETPDEVAKVFYEVDVRVSAPERAVVGTRVQAWYDLMQTLGHSVVAVITGLVGAGVIAVVLNNEVSWTRGGSFVVYVCGALLVCWALLAGRGRVSRLLKAYRDKVITAPAENEIERGGRLP